MSGTSRWAAHASVAAALLAIVIVVASSTDIDMRAADALFAAGGGSWPLAHAGWPRWLFYDGAKVALAAFGLFLMAGMAKPPVLHRSGLSRREAGYLLVCLCLVPVVVGLIKYHSGVSCANALLRYGGDVPDVLGHFTPGRMLSLGFSRGCWPSGHASGGFALLALGCLPRRRAAQRLLWCAGLMAGGTMGAYQVLRGAHFPSHVVVTAAISQLLVCLLAGLMLKRTLPGTMSRSWTAGSDALPG